MKNNLKVSLLLDSGIFSAWSKNEPLSLKKYIKYLQKNEQYLWGYVAMDVIPGTFGQSRDTHHMKGTHLRPEQEKTIGESARGSYENLQKMKDAGLRPIPVFHQGESWEWFEKLLAEEPYIGISTAKELWAKDQRKWLDQVFSIITDKQGRPLVKAHGFGITNPKLILRYPWWSIDSTTWSLTPGYGQIVVPSCKSNGELDYLHPLRVVISGVSHKAAGNQQRQFEALGELEQEVIRSYLENDCKILEVADARYGTTIRRRALLVYYLGLARTLKDIQFENKVSNLLLKQDFAVVKTLKPIKIPQLNIMFATTLSKEWSWLMNDVGANTRLLSYYELKDRPAEELVEYVTTGSIGTYEKKPPKTSWKSETYRNYRRLALLERLRKVRVEEDELV